MDSVTGWIQSISAALFGGDGNPLELLPRLLAAALLLIAGWFIAALCRRLALSLLMGAGKVGRRVAGIGNASDPRFGKAISQVLAAVVFWGVFLLFVAASGRLLQWRLVDRGVDAVAGYLPSIAAAFIVIIAGVIAAGLADVIVARSAHSAGLQRSALLGRISRAAVLIAAAVIAATQLGLDVSFATDAALILLAAVAGAFALGLALGTPAHLSNIIGARSARRLVHPGDTIRIEEHHGTISEISSTHVIVETGEGEVFIPAHLFAKHSFVRQPQGHDHGNY